ncbi:hypothetical protein TRIUR3_15731 [Triticum urartu]|uniref:Uncharacterized protein n=1 Tax=Triticum urartu TaxID=4572 RepID=M7ZBB4_TRIUA|nr:hypothetical protein TRIUR3_15731 [Triticum urartu]
MERSHHHPMPPAAEPDMQSTFQGRRPGIQGLASPHDHSQPPVREPTTGDMERHLLSHPDEPQPPHSPRPSPKLNLPEPRASNPILCLARTLRPARCERGVGKPGHRPLELASVGVWLEPQGSSSHAHAKASGR